MFAAVQKKFKVKNWYPRNVLAMNYTPTAITRTLFVGYALLCIHCTHADISSIGMQDRGVKTNIDYEKYSYELGALLADGTMTVAIETDIPQNANSRPFFMLGDWEPDVTSGKDSCSCASVATTPNDRDTTTLLQYDANDPATWENGALACMNNDTHRDYFPPGESYTVEQLEDLWNGIESSTHSDNSNSPLCHAGEPHADTHSKKYDFTPQPCVDASTDTPDQNDMNINATYPSWGIVDRVTFGTNEGRVTHMTWFLKLNLDSSEHWCSERGVSKTTKPNDVIEYEFVITAGVVTGLDANARRLVIPLQVTKVNSVESVVADTIFQSIALKVCSSSYAARAGIFTSLYGVYSNDKKNATLTMAVTLEYRDVPAHVTVGPNMKLQPKMESVPGTGESAPRQQFVGLQWDQVQLPGDNNLIRIRDNDCYATQLVRVGPDVRMQKALYDTGELAMRSVRPGANEDVGLPVFCVGLNKEGDVVDHLSADSRGSICRYVLYLETEERRLIPSGEAFDACTTGGTPNQITIEIEPVTCVEHLEAGRQALFSGVEDEDEDTMCRPMVCHPTLDSQGECGKDTISIGLDVDIKPGIEKVFKTRIGSFLTTHFDLNAFAAASAEQNFKAWACFRLGNETAFSINDKDGDEEKLSCDDLGLTSALTTDTLPAQNVTDNMCFWIYNKDPGFLSQRTSRLYLDQDSLEVKLGDVDFEKFLVTIKRHAESEYASVTLTMGPPNAQDSFTVTDKLSWEEFLGQMTVPPTNVRNDRIENTQGENVRDPPFLELTGYDGFCLDLSALAVKLTEVFEGANKEWMKRDILITDFLQWEVNTYGYQRDNNYVAPISPTSAPTTAPTTSPTIEPGGTQGDGSRRLLAQSSRARETKVVPFSKNKIHSLASQNHRDLLYYAPIGSFCSRRYGVMPLECVFTSSSFIPNMVRADVVVVAVFPADTVDAKNLSGVTPYISTSCDSEGLSSTSLVVLIIFGAIAFICAIVFVKGCMTDVKKTNPYEQLEDDLEHFTPSGSAFILNVNTQSTPQRKLHRRTHRSLPHER
jgi:hypothetical protein